MYGDESNIKGTDPDAKEYDNYVLDEDNKLLAATERFKEEVEEAEQLKMKPEARECIEWLKKSKVQVRGIKESNLLHGKLYIIQNGGGNGKSPQRNAMVGSSNFTKRGLGFGKGSNYEINLAVGGEECEQYEKWFRKLWDNPELVEDIKEKIIEELEKLKQDQSPEFIYFKTLYEIFRERVEEDKRSGEFSKEIEFTETEIYKALYEFQKTAVTGILHRLKNHNGCILADSVGLGKTYTALAVIKHYEARGKKVLVLCPKKLRANWELYQASSEDRNNPFESDNFSYTLLYHTDLSRTDDDNKLSGRTESGIDLAKIDLGKYDLVVIDESHNFRTDTPSTVVFKDNKYIRKKPRYQRLLEDVIMSGKNSQVLMLSATPVNNSLADLKNQLYLMCSKNEKHFSEILDNEDLGEFFRKMQKKYVAWAKEEPKDRERLDKHLGGDFLRLLDEISISRSRDHIKRYYDLKELGRFPDREKTDNKDVDTDRDSEIEYDTLYKEIADFGLSVYSPARYLRQETDSFKQLETESGNLRQTARESNLIGMMRMSMLKRLESSVNSFRITLGNIIERMDKTLANIEKFQKGIQKNAQTHEDDEEFIKDLSEDDDGNLDDEMVAGEGQVKKIYLKDMRVDDWELDIKRDRALLTKILNKVKVIDKDRDAKLATLLGDIKNKLDNPTIDSDGKPCRKLLIFTSFADTANYLYKNLEEEIRARGANLGLVTGTQCKSTLKIAKFEEILKRFSPNSKGGLDNPEETEEIDIIIGTDCISEGQNLQDCDRVLSYDIHWNPVRIIQRFGRVDRIGSRYKKVQMINYWPTKNLDVYIGIRKRIQDKMELIGTTIDEKNPLSEADAKDTRELFRDQMNNSLMELHNGSTDFDKINENEFNMQNFNLEDFRAQLMQYIGKNEKQLQKAPSGLFAVTDTQSVNDSGNESEKGVPGYIFCLKQKNIQKDKNLGVGLKSNHIYPYILVYMKEDGDELYGYTDVKDILKSFGRLALGKRLPQDRLYEKFNKRTECGKNLSEVEKALGNAQEKIKGDFKINNLLGGNNRNATITKPSALPQQYELITWLVIYS